MHINIYSLYYLMEVLQYLKDVFVNPKVAYRRVVINRQDAFISWLVAYGIILLLSLGFGFSIRYYLFLALCIIGNFIVALFIGLIYWLKIKAYHGVISQVEWEYRESKGFARMYNTNVREDRFINSIVKLLLASIPLVIMLGVGAIFYKAGNLYQLISYLAMFVGWIWGNYIYAEGQAKNLGLPFVKGWGMAVFYTITVIVSWFISYVLVYGLTI